MNTELLFQNVKQIASDYVRGETTRTLAAHMLVDALFRVGNAARAGEITKNESNRLILLILQTVSLILSDRRIDKALNLLRRGNRVLASKPMLVITGFDFSGLTLPQFSMTRAMLIACNFEEADLRGAIFEQCQLQGCTFRGADLSGADFRQSTLYGCSFEEANTLNTRGLG